MFMTSLTTALGFLSNMVSSIPVILSFSSTMSILVIVNYVFVITIFPAILAVRNKYAEKAESTPCTASRGIARWLGGGGGRHTSHADDHDAGGGESLAWADSGFSTGSGPAVGDGFEMAVVADGGDQRHTAPDDAVCLTLEICQQPEQELRGVLQAACRALTLIRRRRRRRRFRRGCTS